VFKVDCDKGVPVIMRERMACGNGERRGEEGRFVKLRREKDKQHEK
jgi:hypothetical protein